MTNTGIETVAAIDIGSNAMRMVIAEITHDGEIKILDDLRQITHIGRDTFAYGRIQISSIKRACEILKGFATVMNEYGVRYYRAVATSGIREAQNREYILEQFRLKTGILVEVIDNAIERFLTYKGIGDLPSIYKGLRDESTLIIDIGSGGVEVSVYCDGSLSFTEYLKVGSLRLREILADLEKRTLDFPGIMEEFIDSKIYFLEPYIKKLGIHNFIGLGGELKAISQLCIGKKKARRDRFISKEEISRLYNEIRAMTQEQIMEEYRVNRERAQVLLPAMIIFNRFLEMTKAKGIYTPMVSLRHGLLADMVDNRLNTKRKKEFLDDVISSVRQIGRRYEYDESHAFHVEKLATSIFDQTREIHGMDEKSRFYLQIASLLHDIGKYVNLNNHDVHSYNIIRSIDIIGLSNRELVMLANLARFHSEEEPLSSYDSYTELNEVERILVSKLAGILQLADALDISHRQKIKDVQVDIDDDEICFMVNTVEDVLLERWTFNNKSKLFEEIMGIRPLFKHKGETI